MSGPTITIDSVCDTRGYGSVKITFHDVRRATAKNAEEALNREIQKITQDQGQRSITATLVKGNRLVDPSGPVWIYALSPGAHPEQALFQAGASDGHCYEIVGASYGSPAAGQPETATIDLSTPDQTGCLLTHDYGTGATTLKWDGGGELYGTEEDVQTAVEDITGGRLNHQALFIAFRMQMTSAGTKL